MTWCEVMVQKVEDARGDGRVRVGAHENQIWMMRIETTVVWFGGHDT